MDPVVAIVWIAVAVFAATSLITLLYLVGFVPAIKQEHGKLLFRLLITEIVVASVAAFTYFIQSSVRRETLDRLPVVQLTIFEQKGPYTVYDGSTPLHLRAADVSRARHAVDLDIDLRSDFTSKTHVQLEANVPQVVSVGDRKYRIGFTQTGTVDPNPNEKQGRESDFAYLSVTREDQ